MLNFKKFYLFINCLSTFKKKEKKSKISLDKNLQITQNNQTILKIRPYAKNNNAHLTKISNFYGCKF